MFDIQDGQEFKGIRSGAGKRVQSEPLRRARKGTPEYDKWLEAYKAKRGKKQDSGKETAKTLLSEKTEPAISKWAKTVPLDSWDSLDDLASVLKQGFKKELGYDGVSVTTYKNTLSVTADIADDKALTAIGKSSDLEKRLQSELGAEIEKLRNPDFGIGFKATFPQLA